MKSSYANVCNVTSTREEVVMLFGINQAWNRGQQEVTIQLTDRIIISPYAAKRLVGLLQGVVQEVEALLARALPADVPVMKAVGVREFAAHVAGETSLKAALAEAQQATRNYAKRQLTWFRNQTPEWPTPTTESVVTPSLPLQPRAYQQDAWTGDRGRP